MASAKAAAAPSGRQRRKPPSWWGAGNVTIQSTGLFWRALMPGFISLTLDMIPSFVVQATAPFVLMEIGTNPDRWYPICVASISAGQIVSLNLVGTLLSVVDPPALIWASIVSSALAMGLLGFCRTTSTYVAGNVLVGLAALTDPVVAAMILELMPGSDPISAHLRAKVVAKGFGFVLGPAFGVFIAPLGGYRLTYFLISAFCAF
ncbi:unnamed protein product [Vitrella brassicaformis CCMP3155]|uniref:Major facilitator superfamily (MFS) profile domain-containing protein n=1 Tax=Vitrella brassicaformis (strain CCMP3155) TaxID=1169540 RepID=A0A0G4G8Z8_VITBC|nr:unnamed protein product [Vitrella brassicaformis CCMP3155]|eukprot:CEM25291.1 unnamed protein product [Vitrella brassicaformis CCMP3155]